jgi:L-alanine-DL-glutamate epimerase-like enolase superfamily enzyme
VKLSVHPYFLEFNRPFALAHGTRTGTNLAFVKIEHEDIIVYGEASLPPYRKETFDTVKKWVERQYEQIMDLISKNPFQNPDDIPFSKENPSASAALQSAILNWFVTSKGKNLSDYFGKKGIEPVEIPALTLTITKNDFDFLEEKLHLAKHFSHLKLKLTGSDDDFDFVKAIRNKTDLPFCIDINQGYLKCENAIILISKLEKLDCILIEQPLKDHNHDGHYWLKQRSTLPIIADESICLYEDLLQFHEAYSGVNVKLMKCGGLFQAQKMLDFAGEKKMMKLLGCMSESSLGVSTASVLASQCKIADLDAPYLNRNDPFEGFKIKEKKIEVDKIKLKKNILFE